MRVTQNMDKAIFVCFNPVHDGGHACPPHKARDE